MTVRKPKNRKHWHFEIQVNGKRHSKGGFETKLEAQEAEVYHRKMLKKPVGDTAIDYLIMVRSNELEKEKTLKYYLQNVSIFKKFRVFLNGTATMVSDIDRNCIEDFLRACYRTPRMYNYALRILRALFNYGLERGWFDKNPTKGIKYQAVDVNRKYIPPKKDLEKVIQYAEWEDMVFLLTLKNTLARVNEIYNLTWNDVDFHNRTVTLWTRKKKGGARTPRTLPMTDELFNSLSTLEMKGSYVFWNDKTKDKFDDKKKMLIGLCKRAGVRRFGYHNIRHLSASILASKNVSLPDIQELLGHENVTTTAIYIQSLVGSKSKAIHLLSS